MTISPVPTPTPSPTPQGTPSEDDLLDESLDETFPASDAVQPQTHEKLPPAHAPGSDVKNR